MNRKCEFCGAKLNKNDTFCKDCGMTINKKAVDAVLEDDRTNKPSDQSKLLIYAVSLIAAVILILLLI